MFLCTDTALWFAVTSEGAVLPVLAVSTLNWAFMFVMIWSPCDHIIGEEDPSHIHEDWECWVGGEIHNVVTVVVVLWCLNSIRQIVALLDHAL